MGHWTFIFALWIVQIHFYFFTPPSSDHKQETRPSPAGNRTPVSRVTGGDTDHYTTEEYTNTRAATRAKVPKVPYTFEALCGASQNKTCAPGEDRTHGLQIMRLTRCLLRYRGHSRPRDTSGIRPATKAHTPTCQKEGPADPDVI